MKIVITVPTYYPKTDGVSIVTKYLAEGLVKKGHDITIVTSNKDIKDNNSEHNNVKIIRVNLYTRVGFYFGDKKTYYRIIDELLMKSDILINVCTQNAFTDLLLPRLKKYKCKKILYLHGMFDFRLCSHDFTNVRSIFNKIWKQIRWSIFYFKNRKNFMLYNIVTQLHKKEYGTYFFKKKFNIDSYIIENAADDDFFNSTLNKKFIKPVDKYILYVANYMDSKNQKLAIKEFYKANIDKSISLVLIGSKKNEYFMQLEKLNQELRNKYHLNKNEKNVLMLYGIERDLIASYVKSSYLYIMTSKVEKYPISLIESMACGIPFISTDVGVAKYLLGGVVSKKEDIHFYIELILKNEKYRNLLGELGKNYAINNSQINDKVNILNDIINKICKGENHNEN